MHRFLEKASQYPAWHETGFRELYIQPISLILVRTPGLVSARTLTVQSNIPRVARHTACKATQTLRWEAESECIRSAGGTCSMALSFYKLGVLLRSLRTQITTMNKH
jgi:hypothetical protein